MTAETTSTNVNQQTHTEELRELLVPTGRLTETKENLQHALRSDCKVGQESACSIGSGRTHD